ncbi:insulinase family protein [Candidatus Kaiserbacteria bacterium]|nr:insulinase family protein [Candidatus Kaiserbacteria bacterium]
MSYASKIKEKRFKTGARALFSAFPAHGEISIVGSLKGGVHLAQGFVCEGIDECTLSGDVLADMHAAMLLDGTTAHTKTEIQIMLDTIGASLSFAAEKDRLVFHARVRAVYADKLLSLIAECLREPIFPQEELAHLKSRMIAELSLEAQNPHEQASINLSRTLFGIRHPNRQEDTAHSKAAVEQMNRKELCEYHTYAIDRSLLIVSIAGDMKKEKAFTLVEKYFSTLPQRTVTIPPYDRALPQKARKVVTPIPDKASIDYILGSVTGITNTHTDYPALLLGLQVLGSRSGFTGRLMKIVREVEGLTYGVYSYPGGFMYGTDGYVAIWGTFAPELFERGRASILREIKRIVEEGPTASEVKQHREMYEARSRVLCATNSMDLARVAHDCAVEGKKPSYLDEFPKQVLKLTKAQVHKALKKYLVIENLSESVAGPVSNDKATSIDK